jgi:uncharacterized 2Fe-2S/4Fe-4S cluster protein (DUF4445 family)
MSSYKVKFIPDGKEVEVPANTNLIEAARKAGVYVNSLCGGQGVCGKCKVRITRGKVEPDKHAIGFFSKEDRRNHVLNQSKF